MKALRTHPDEIGYRPDRSLTKWGVCMHQGFGPFRISQSVGSLVSEINSDIVTNWLTGTSAPCTGIFKPVWIDSGLPALGKRPTNQFDPETLWWKHEQLHREVIKDYPNRIRLYELERDNYEHEMYKMIDNKQLSAQERKTLTLKAFKGAGQKTEEWISRIKSEEIQSKNKWFYTREWNKINHKAGMNRII